MDAEYQNILIPWAVIENRVWTIDLSQSWTKESVQPTSVSRSCTPWRLRFGSLWYDQITDSVYSFGGELGKDGVASESSASIAPLKDSTWPFALFGDQTSGERSEAVNPVWKTGLFSSEISAFMFRYTRSDFGQTYYIGTRASKWSRNKTGDTSLHSDPGLIIFDYATATLENSTNNGSYFTPKFGGISTRETVSLAKAGLMTYAPPFGIDGICVILGGLEIDETGMTKQRSDNVTIYDPSTRRWHYQRATGDIPEMRFDQFYCAFGAYDSILSTYDMYVGCLCASACALFADNFGDKFFLWSLCKWSHLLRSVASILHLACHKHKLESYPNRDDLHINEEPSSDYYWGHEHRQSKLS